MASEMELPHSAVVADSGSVLVIEDHPLYRDALVQVLIGEFGKGKVVSADSVEKAMHAATSVADLRMVLLDIGLPGVSGSEAVSAVRGAFPDSIIVVISASEDRRDATAALRAGASLFVSKTVTTSALCDIVRSAITDKAILQGEWIVPGNQPTSPDDAFPGLTPRQHEVLALITKGYSNKDIAWHLNLSEGTVKMHVSALLRKLAVDNRVGAVLMARRMGLERYERAETSVV